MNSLASISEIFFEHLENHKLEKIPDPEIGMTIHFAKSNTRNTGKGIELSPFELVWNKDPNAMDSILNKMIQLTILILIA